MTAKIIDGKAIADEMKAEIAEGVKKLAASGIKPGLATVLVGDNPASHTYVGMKRKMCAELGISHSGISCRRRPLRMKSRRWSRT